MQNSCESSGSLRVSRLFLTQVLGVSTHEYTPFAFFCLLCPHLV
jgi:hypothetical protein